MGRELEVTTLTRQYRFADCGVTGQWACA